MQLSKYCMVEIFVTVLIGIFCIGIAANRQEEYGGYERRFTFISPLKWDYTALGMEEAAREQNASMKYVYFDGLDTQRQVEAIREAILSEVDGIITAGMEDSEELYQVIDEVKEAGIPLVLVDNDLKDSSRICYVGTDNKEMGKRAADTLAGYTEGKAEVGVIVSSLEAPNQRQRLDGLKEVLEQYPGMEIVDVRECNSNRISIYQELPQMLEDHPEIDALFLAEAASTAFVGDVLEKSGMSEKDLKIVGIDGVNRGDDPEEYGNLNSYMSKSQWQIDVFQQDFFAQGYEAVQVLCRWIRGENVERCIYTDIHRINQDNVNDLNEQYSGEIAWHQY